MVRDWVDGLLQQGNFLHQVLLMGVPVPVAGATLQLSAQPALGQLPWWNVFLHWWKEGKEHSELNREQDPFYPSNVPSCIGFGTSNFLNRNPWFFLRVLTSPHFSNSRP